MFKSCSPLEARLAQGGRDGADGTCALRLTEMRDWHLLQIGVFAGRAGALDAVDAVVRSVTGAALPDSTSAVTETAAHRLYRIAADQYWLISLEEKVGRSLEQAVPPDSGTVTVLSGARVRLRLEGSAACAVLAHHVAIDLDLTEFPVGRFALTGIDHAGVLLERRGRDRFEVFVLSTFAASAWDLLVDTALPHGYEVGVESAAVVGSGRTAMIT